MDGQLTRLPDNQNYPFDQASMLYSQSQFLKLMTDEYIKEIKSQLFKEIHGVEKIDILENKSIERGGCILETSMGTIDATINTQLEIVYEKLIESINKSKEKHNKR